jgi:hypothetical protein
MYEGLKTCQIGGEIEYVADFPKTEVFLPEDVHKN